MPRFASILLLAAVGTSAGCYTERLPPPAYRYPCDADGDCADGQSCVVGLCEFRCSLTTFEADCPADGNYLACINGLCANGCDVETPGTCPELMECIDLSALGIDVPSSGSPFGGGSSNATIGVCGRMCETGDDTCPSGEICILGFCTPECDPADASSCPDGLECSATLGICAPPGIDSAGDSAMGSDGTAGGTGSGTTTATGG